MGVLSGPMLRRPSSLSRNSEDVGGLNVWAQGNVVGAVVPGVVDTGQQVLNIEVLVVGDAQHFQIEVNPARLFVMGIEVDGYQNRVVSVRTVGSGLRVAHQIGVIDGMEME